MTKEKDQAKQQVFRNDQRKRLGKAKNLQESGMIQEKRFDNKIS